MKRRYIIKPRAWFDDYEFHDSGVQSSIMVFEPERGVADTGLVDHLGNPLCYVDEFPQIGFFNHEEPEETD